MTRRPVPSSASVPGGLGDRDSSLSQTCSFTLGPPPGHSRLCAVSAQAMAASHQRPSRSHKDLSLASLTGRVWATGLGRGLELSPDRTDPIPQLATPQTRSLPREPRPVHSPASAPPHVLQLRSVLSPAQEDLMSHRPPPSPILGSPPAPRSTALRPRDNTWAAARTPPGSLTNPSPQPTKPRRHDSLNQVHPPGEAARTCPTGTVSRMERGGGEKEPPPAPKRLCFSYLWTSSQRLDKAAVTFRGK